MCTNELWPWHGIAINATDKVQIGGIYAMALFMV